jgi:hypothetical protein
MRESEKMQHEQTSHAVDEWLKEMPAFNAGVAATIGDEDERERWVRGALLFYDAATRAQAVMLSVLSG